MIEDTPFFELSMTDPDGRPIAPLRFPTVQDAMTAAEDYCGMSGAISFFRNSDAESMQVIIFGADGSIDVGEAVPDDDEWEDDPWTEAEIEHNFRVGREMEERRARGESVRFEDLEANSPEARTELYARVEAERAARCSDD